MGKPYSDDLRERVVAAIEAGHTRVKVAKLYNMALSTVGGIIKRKRETGSAAGCAENLAKCERALKLVGHRGSAKKPPGKRAASRVNDPRDEAVVAAV